MNSSFPCEESKRDSGLSDRGLRVAIVWNVKHHRGRSVVGVGEIATVAKRNPTTKLSALFKFYHSNHLFLLIQSERPLSVGLSSTCIRFHFALLSIRYVCFQLPSLSTSHLPFAVTPILRDSPLPAMYCPSETHRILSTLQTLPSVVGRYP